jgi:hypothetical protein
LPDAREIEIASNGLLPLVLSWKFMEIFGRILRWIFADSIALKRDEKTFQRESRGLKVPDCNLRFR